MTSGTTQIRFYGTALNVSDTYVDCEITEIRLDNSVTLSEVDGDRTWETSTGEINSQLSRGSAGRIDTIVAPDHVVWEKLDGLRADLATEPFSLADESFDDDVRELFMRVMSLMTDDTLQAKVTAANTEDDEGDSEGGGRGPENGNGRGPENGNGRGPENGNGRGPENGNGQGA